MTNINDYIIFFMELKKAINSLQVFIGPNIHQDIEDAKTHMKSLMHNIQLIKFHIKKQNRVNKIKKHKKNKKTQKK